MDLPWMFQEPRTPWAKVSVSTLNHVSFKSQTVTGQGHSWEPWTPFSRGLGACTGLGRKRVMDLTISTKPQRAYAALFPILDFHTQSLGLSPRPPT